MVFLNSSYLQCVTGRNVRFSPKPDVSRCLKCCVHVKMPEGIRMNVSSEAADAPPAPPAPPPPPGLRPQSAADCSLSWHIPEIPIGAARAYKWSHLENVKCDRVVCVSRNGPRHRRRRRRRRRRRHAESPFVWSTGPARLYLSWPSQESARPTSLPRTESGLFRHRVKKNTNQSNTRARE